jgi:hypothetical protein
MDSKWIHPLECIKQFFVPILMKITLFQLLNLRIVLVTWINLLRKAGKTKIKYSMKSDGNDNYSYLGIE